MIYHYTLLTLYRPTKETVLGAAGDWSIQASSQASLAFRKSQMDRQIAQGWVGVSLSLATWLVFLFLTFGAAFSTIPVWGNSALLLLGHAPRIPH